MPKTSGGDDNPTAKKKPKKDKQTSLLAYKSNPAQLNEVLTNSYRGKRILLTAAFLYGRRIPRGEEDLLFQYHINAVNSDNKTATIDYDDRCIKNGDHVFQSYPDQIETNITNYDLATFQQDHKVFLRHLGRGQKIINDAKEAREKEEKAAASESLVDLTDIDEKIQQGIAIYDILLAEFEPVGDMMDHIVEKGDHKGKVIKKQKWSEYTSLCIIHFASLVARTHPAMTCDHQHQTPRIRASKMTL